MFWVGFSPIKYGYHKTMGRDLSGLRTPKIVWGGFLNEDMVGEKKKKDNSYFPQSGCWCHNFKMDSLPLLLCYQNWYPLPEEFIRNANIIKSPGLLSV